MLKLLRNLRRQEWAMAAVCAVLILGQINFDLALPDYMSSLTVLIKTPGSTLSDILHTGLEMLGCTLASAVLCVICGYLTAKVAAGFSFSIREAVFHKIADFGQQEMMTFSVPSLINRTTNDITQVQMLTAMGLQILIKSPVMAVWAIIKIVGKSWTLSAITAGFVAALLVMMAVIIGVVVPRFRRVQKLTDHINLVARENLNGINVVHAYNAEDYQNAKFWKGNEELMRTQLFNQRAFAFLMPGVTLAMNALSLVIYWVGASIVNAVPAADTAVRLAAFSDIVVFGTYATYVIMSIMMMVMIIMMLPAAQVSAQRINEVLETRNSLTQGARIDALETGTVEFRDVSFHYPSSDKNVLEHITFQAKRGETVAFIGATGSGKTTLVSLAARFYDATEGTVLVDGVDVRDYTFDALYDRIGYVTQKAILFSGDVRGNVLFGASRGMDSDADVVVVFGGTNDFGHGDAKLGTFESRDPYTFYGAMHVLCEKLIHRFPNADILFMTPLHRCSENEALKENGLPEETNLAGYVSIIREVAEFYGLPVLDLFSTSGLQPKVDIIKETYMPDGLHPSDAGALRIARRLIGFLQTL